MEFSSDLQKMKCPYCDTEFEVETLKELDDQLKTEGEDELNWERPQGSEWKEEEKTGMNVYICSSCGGEILVDGTTSATSCPFCDNPVVIKERVEGLLRPDFILPFRLDKEDAKKALLAHFKGKTLLPEIFKSENHVDEIKGVYVPFWLFDADAHANLRYRATRVRSWSTRDYIYTETQHFSIIRQGEIGFEHVPADGSTKMADDLMESIEPYNSAELKDFQTAYMAGYTADKYDVTAEQSIERANARIKQSTADAFAATVQGYSTVQPENTVIKLTSGKTRYALYPVWLLNTTFRGKKYTFAMNGQTGKFVGDLPVDRKKYWAWLGGLTAGIGAAMLAVLYLIHLF